MRIRLLLALAVVTAACGDKGTTAPSTNKTVDIFTIGDAFSPTFAELAVGDTARWSFTGGSDGLGHNVRFNPRITGSPADVNVLKTGTASRVFNAKGTFKYDCDVHPGMRAEITVQ
jgi:plastocyanin